MRTALLLVALAAACRREAPPPAAAPGSTTLRVPKVADGVIRVDGDLRDAAWASAASTGALVHPATGAMEPRSRVQGEARFAWSDTRLYVVVRVGDREPARPFAPTEDDPHLWERSSAVELMLQPGDPGDNRNYYEVQADTACAKWTTRFDDYNRPQTVDAQGRRRYGHQEWSPALECAARVGPDGYVIELALPWRDVAEGARTAVPPREGDTWRANVYSFRDGQRDSLAWSPLRGEGNFHYAPRFGRLVFAR